MTLPFYCKARQFERKWMKAWKKKNEKNDLKFKTQNTCLSLQIQLTSITTISFANIPLCVFNYFTALLITSCSTKLSSSTAMTEFPLRGFFPLHSTNKQLAEEKTMTLLFRLPTRIPFHPRIRLPLLHKLASKYWIQFHRENRG